MSTVWFTSDTHFGHKRVAELRGWRPESVDGYNETLIQRWNATVMPEDTVWHLGDVGFGRGLLQLVQRLNGTKHLVSGNHDEVWPGHRSAHQAQPTWLSAFRTVQPFAKIRVGDEMVLLSHFPYAGGGDHTDVERFTQFRLQDEGMWLFHGHTHSTERITGVNGSRQLHVGLDAWHMIPVDAPTLIRVMRRHDERIALTAGT